MFPTVFSYYICFYCCRCLGSLQQIHILLVSWIYSNASCSVRSSNVCRVLSSDNQPTSSYSLQFIKTVHQHMWRYLVFNPSGGAVCCGEGYRQAYESTQHQGRISSATLPRCHRRDRFRDWHCFAKQLVRGGHIWLSQGLCILILDEWFHSKIVLVSANPLSDRGETCGPVYSICQAWAVMQQQCISKTGTAFIENCWTDSEMVSLKLVAGKNETGAWKFELVLCLVLFLPSPKPL